ncbi:hypothetical protein AYO49_04960 [Verrucomicrobiaceae bacterium SCGC AG-212-N21]|nr:hypothetical protein AYO49_04960 [Verrucomicrobiaceae bacterium SCGC AG-212-N21]
MQFMILMIPAGYRNNTKPGPGFPDLKEMEKMGRFNDRLAESIEVLSLDGLHPLTEGARLSFSKGKATVTDGPFIETKEVLGGYWIVEAKSKEQVVKLWQDCPAEEGDIIEIRQVFSEEDLGIKK